MLVCAVSPARLPPTRAKVRGLTVDRSAPSGLLSPDERVSLNLQNVIYDRVWRVNEKPRLARLFEDVAVLMGLAQAVIAAQHTV